MLMRKRRVAGPDPDLLQPAGNEHAQPVSARRTTTGSPQTIASNHQTATNYRASDLRRRHATKPMRAMHASHSGIALGSGTWTQALVAHGLTVLITICALALKPATKRKRPGYFHMHG